MSAELKTTDDQSAELRPIPRHYSTEREAKLRLALQNMAELARLREASEAKLREALVPVHGNET